MPNVRTSSPFSIQSMNALKQLFRGPAMADADKAECRGTLQTIFVEGRKGVSREGSLGEFKEVLRDHPWPQGNRSSDESRLVE